jgi:phenylalanine-4-hydroxylase
MSVTVSQYAAECAAQGMRGDYTRCRADFTVPQDYGVYSEADQAVWRTLCDRQTKLTERHAHHSYLDGIAALGLIDRVPDFETVSAKLSAMTGWTLVAVPGLIPAEPFFDHLANRRFPVTNWLRSMDELDYIVEPDMFHDFFGHVPILTQPDFADFMQRYGEKALELIPLGGDRMVTRLYWYTAEFGLIREPGQDLKVFGAGLMSSFSELQFAAESGKANRVPMDIETIMRTGYEIDAFQRAYFVLPSFEALNRQMAESDLAAIVRRYKDDAPLDPAALPARKAAA